MPVNVPPFALRGPVASPFPHSAALDRRMFGTGWATEGVIGDAARDGANSLRVSANPTPNMTVNVAQGEAVILADGQLAAGQGVGYYLFHTSGVTSVAIAAAGAASRVDLVVAEVLDETYAGATGSSTARLRAITGVPGAGAPALPDNAIRLATVNVSAGVTTITAAAVVDQRTYAARPADTRVAAAETRLAAAESRLNLTETRYQLVEQTSELIAVTGTSGNGVYQVPTTVTQPANRELRINAAYQITNAHTSGPVYMAVYLEYRRDGGPWQRLHNYFWSAPVFDYSDSTQIHAAVGSMLPGDGSAHTLEFRIGYKARGALSTSVTRVDVIDVWLTPVLS